MRCCGWPSFRSGSRENRRALIEEAFRRAAGAQYSIKQRAASSTLRNGPAAFLDKAFAQDLDRNSLQCRAVRALLPLDRKQARELFGEIPRPRLRPATCDNALVYDVSAYYATLAELTASAFTPAERAETSRSSSSARTCKGCNRPWRPVRCRTCLPSCRSNRNSWADW